MKLPEFGKILLVEEKRLILGPPTQRLFPLKYPWMREDYYKNAKKNHWEPEDVNMMTDRNHYYHELSEQDRRMFDWSLAMLTTQDLVVLGNLEEGIQRHITVPEATMYLARQEAEEAIHTDSYQYITESLSLDETGVYDKYLLERSLYNKVEYAYQFHRRLMELRIDDHDSHDGIGEFLTCLAFWALGMEGGWFYSGFTWAYALNRRGLMPGTGEMFQYIQRDEYLHMSFWVDVINVLIREYPKAYTPAVQASIIAIMKDVVHLEEAYAHDTCKDVFGITPDGYMSHFRARMNNNLKSIGLEPVWGMDKASILPWVSEFELKKEGNFFETRITAYQKSGTLDWGDTNDEPNSVM